MRFKGLRNVHSFGHLIPFLIICPMEIISNMKKRSPPSTSVIIKCTSCGVKFRFDFSFTLSFAVCTMEITATSYAGYEC